MLSPLNQAWPWDKTESLNVGLQLQIPVGICYLALHSHLLWGLGNSTLYSFAQQLGPRCIQRIVGPELKCPHLASKRTPEILQKQGICV